MQHSPQNQWDVCLAYLLLSFCQLSPGAGALRVSVICPLKTWKLPKLKYKNIKIQTGNNSVWVDPNLPGQVGVPLEHSTAHHQNPTHCSRGCPTGIEHTAHHLNPTNWSSECPTGTHSIPSKPHKLVKWVSRWNKLLTTKTPQTGQEGVAQEHTAHQPNPTDWPSNFQSAASTWPVYFCVALASTSIHPWWGLAIQLLHVGTKHSKASETKLACLTNMHNRPNVLSCHPCKCACLFTSLDKWK